MRPERRASTRRKVAPGSPRAEDGRAAARARAGRTTSSGGPRTIRTGMGGSTGTSHGTSRFAMNPGPTTTR
eukprot:9914435-Alexandrium_andersonii.AAC.1